MNTRTVTDAIPKPIEVGSQIEPATMSLYLVGATVLLTRIQGGRA